MKKVGSRGFFRILVRYLVSISPDLEKKKKKKLTLENIAPPHPYNRPP